MARRSRERKRLGASASLQKALLVQTASALVRMVHSEAHHAVGGGQGQAVAAAQDDDGSSRQLHCTRVWGGGGAGAWVGLGDWGGAVQAWQAIGHGWQGRCSRQCMAGSAGTARAPQ